MINLTTNCSGNNDCDTNATGATILSPVLMSLTGVIGHILALLSLYKAKTDVRTTKFYSLIKGLVWTDLLGIMLTSPSVILAYSNQREWLGGEVHCRFHGFTMATFGLATPLIICAMAVERFLALRCVFFYSSRCKTGTARGCILLLWFGTLLYGLLPLFGFGKYEKQYPGTWCYVDFHSESIATKVYNYIYACATLILILLIMICNTYVVVKLFRTRLRRTSECVYTLGDNILKRDSQITLRCHRKSSDTESQMIVLLFALTLVFTVCWAPLMMRIIITQATGKTDVLLDLAAVRLASLNQTLDPWLYILFRRSTCMKILNGARQIKTKCLNVVWKNPPQENNQIENQYIINNRLQIGDVGNIHESYKENTPPDVMQNVDERSKLPLPDVTNTSSENRKSEDSCYVCHFQFGKPAAETIDKGMYVKILYLKNGSDPDINNVTTLAKQ